MRIVNNNSPLKSVVEHVFNNKEKILVVNEEQKLIGVIDKRILNVYKDQQTKIEKVTRSITGLTEDQLEDLEKVINGFMENGDFIVVVDKNRRPLRIVEIKEYLDIFKQFLANLSLKELIDPNIQLISEKASLNEARTTMIREGVDFLIVIDSKKKPIGLITYDEVLLYEMLSNKPGKRDYERQAIMQKNLKDIIYEELNIASYKSKLDELLENEITLIYDKGIRGVIRRKDILRAILKNIRYTKADVQVFGLDDNYSYNIILKELIDFKHAISKILENPIISLRFKKSKTYEGKLTIHSQNYPILIAEDINYDPITLTKHLINTIKNKISRSKKGKNKKDIKDLD